VAVAVGAASGGAGGAAAGRPASFSLGIGPASLPLSVAGAGGGVGTGRLDVLPTERVFAVDEPLHHVVAVPGGPPAVPVSRARLVPVHGGAVVGGDAAGGASPPAGLGRIHHPHHHGHAGSGERRGVGSDEEDAGGSPVAGAEEVLGRAARHAAHVGDGEGGGDAVAELFGTAARRVSGEAGDGGGRRRSGSGSGSASGSEARTPQAGGGVGGGGGGVVVPRLVGVSSGAGDRDGGEGGSGEGEEAGEEAAEDLIYYETFVRVMFSY